MLFIQSEHDATSWSISNALFIVISILLIITAFIIQNNGIHNTQTYVPFLCYNVFM